jgi:large subunit ribosomal protein L31e
MAEAKLEREYIIPLRKEWLKAPSFKRAKKAVKASKEFLARHMKTDIENVRLGRFLNEELWARGIKNPPHKIKVIASKEGVMVRAEKAELNEAQKKVLEEDKKAVDQNKKEKEEKIKKAKEEEEKEKAKAEKAVKEAEEKIKKEMEKKAEQDSVTKEYASEKSKEKAQPKQLAQQQSQHTMKRAHSEGNN